MSKVLQTSVRIHDLCTELVVQPFADRILVLITQVGKVGCLIQASMPSTTNLRAHDDAFDASDPHAPLPAPSPAIQLTPIFGSAPSAHLQALYSLYVAQIATLVWLTVGGAPRSVVVGIALEKKHTEEVMNEEEQRTFHGVMAALRALLQNTCT